MLNVFATLAFCSRTALYVRNITTAHRKFFHVTASFVATSGFLYDPSFTVLCGHLVIQIFIILEVIILKQIQSFVLDPSLKFCKTMVRYA
jgi:hypothetical protein